MTYRARQRVLRALLTFTAITLAACGDSPVTVPQASAAGLIGPNVTVTQTGDAQAQIVPASANFRIDDAHLVQVTVAIKSTAAASQTVSVRASLYDKDGHLVGDATGGALDVAPGAQVTVQLSGPTPNGTVASATFEVHLVPTPTPLH
ncbi:MAG TPA: FxLYD domain-containing protein [Candidatus Dormibacteraeota bacterium]|jgi:antitoxin (DNA-binding transcriptional repressor) of toxin-antitoxin stability system|nr:FxLYD domain-containing protein [Candidatus Dormibacteraeota bacterium]